jgi:hypothetical protein
MVFNSDELEIIEYLRSWKGEFVSVAEICRRAGGRRKFVESPNWAKLMMARLMDAGVVEVNDRGHFAYCMQNSAPVHQRKRSDKNKQSFSNQYTQGIDENYFSETKEAQVEEAANPIVSEPQVIDEDYFPGSEEPFFTSISKPVVRVDPESPAPTIVDEDYFPVEEEPLFTSISKPTVGQDSASSSSSLIIDEDYFPGSDESPSQTR